MEENNLSVAHKDYDFTVLTCLFAGSFGLHRLLNGRKKSGATMFGISLFSMLLSLVPIIGFIGIVLLFITSIWALIDLLMISSNHFKNGQEELVGYDGKYFKNQANIIVISMVILSTIVFITFMLNFIYSVNTVGIN